MRYSNTQHITKVTKGNIVRESNQRRLPHFHLRLMLTFKACPSPKAPVSKGTQHEKTSRWKPRYNFYYHVLQNPLLESTWLNDRGRRTATPITRSEIANSRNTRRIRSGNGSLPRRRETVHQCRGRGWTSRRRRTGEDIIGPRCGRAGGVDGSM